MESSKSPIPVFLMEDIEAKQTAECFGRIEIVFPMGPDGLRQTPHGCFECGAKTACLRTALSGEQGVAVHEERLARAYDAGTVGFLQRWAHHKTLQRRKRADAPWRAFWKRLRSHLHR
jgi:hypothetical protein